jgi:hypothetical protein
MLSVYFPQLTFSFGSTGTDGFHETVPLVL